MSINFYVKFNICDKCGRLEELHLGKAACGWKFLIQANGFEHYKNWEEMKEWLKDKQIFDEYDKEVSLADFIEWVENRKNVIEPINAESQGEIINGYKFYNGEFF